MFPFFLALCLRHRNIANDIAAVSSMCGLMASGVVGATDVDVVGYKVIGEVENDVVGS